MSIEVNVHGILSDLTDEAYKTMVVGTTDEGELYDRPMYPAELLIERLQAKLGPQVTIGSNHHQIDVFMCDAEGTLQPASYEGLKVAVDLYEGLKSERNGWPGGRDQWKATDYTQVAYLASDSGAWNHVVCTLTF